MWTHNRQNVKLYLTFADSSLYCTVDEANLVLPIICRGTVGAYVGNVSGFADARNGIHVTETR